MTREEAEEILGLSPGYGPQEVKKAYRKASLATHPDRTGESDFSLFLLVQSAFEMLSLLGTDDLEEPEPVWSVGSVISILEVRCGGILLPCSFMGQLAEIKTKTYDHVGEKVVSRLAISVSCSPGVELVGDRAEIVLEDGGEVEVIFRDIVQRSYDRQGRVTAFWVDVLPEPFFEEERIWWRAASRWGDEAW